MKDGRVCAFAATVVAALIVYGSLVPFDLTTTNPLDLLVGLARIPLAPWPQVSRMDLFVNVAVGLPLGFFLTGAWRSTWGRDGMAAALSVLAVVCASALLAVAVEALQAFSPTRDSSWNDVVAQTVGALAGSMTWAVAGGKVMRWIQRLSDEPELSTRAIHLLQLYLPIYFVLQLTSVDPFRVAKLVTQYAGSGSIPIPPHPHLASSFLVARGWIANGLLNAPIGALAVIGWLSQGRRRRPGRAFLLGLSILGCVSVAQVLAGLGSIHLGNVVAATFGIGAGIAATTRFPSPWRDVPRDRLPVVRICAILATAAWLLLLVGQAWQPFDFQLSFDIVRQRLSRVSLVPFVFYYWYSSYLLSPLQAVHEGLLNFVLAVPLGLLPRLSWGTSRQPRSRQVETMVITFAAAMALIGIELGQMFLPTRFPDVSDVLIGTVGVIVGEFMGRGFVPRWQASGYGIQEEGMHAARRVGSAVPAAPIANQAQRQQQRAAAKRSTARS